MSLVRPNADTNVFNKGSEEIISLIEWHSEFLRTSIKIDFQRKKERKGIDFQYLNSQSSESILLKLVS